MADSEALAIVRTALAMRASHPNAPALDVLDLATKGRHESYPDFEDGAAPGGDWTDPASEFGTLLIEAFDTKYTVQEWKAACVGGMDAEQSEAWERVTEAFASRYKLWNHPG
jgi:hypothetical protein